MEIIKPIKCSECGQIKDKEARYSCDYCKKEGKEKEFPIKITVWAQYPIEDDNEYRHYCTFVELLADINNIIGYSVDYEDRVTIETNGEILNEIKSLNNG